MSTRSIPSRAEQSPRWSPAASATPAPAIEAAIPPATALLRQPLWLLLAIVAVAAALRLHELDRLSFWFDEAATVHFARMAPWEMWGRDTHPPLYYLLIHFWLLGGDSEWWLRLLSLLFSLGTLVGIYYAGRALGGVRVGLLAAALLALAGFELRFAQEARMYAMLACATAWALSGLMPLLMRPAAASGPDSRRHWRNYVLGSLLAVWSHNMGFLWPVAATAAVLPLLWAEPGRRALLLRWLKANVIVLVLWLPYWPWLLHQASGVLSGFHIEQPSIERLSNDLSWIHLGMRRPDEAWEFIGIALGLVPLALGLATLRRRIAAALLLLIAVPVVVSLAMAVWQPLYANRVLLWTAQPSALLAAFGLDWLWRRRGYFLPVLTGLLLLLVLAARGVAAWDYVYERQKADWRGVMETLAAELSADSVVVLSPGFESYTWTYYIGRLQQEGRPMPPLQLVQVLTGRQAQAMAALIERSPERVTFILSPWFDAERLVDPQEFLERTLGCARLVERRVFSGIYLLDFDTGPACASSG